MTDADLQGLRERGYHIERGLFDRDEVAELQCEADRLLTLTDLISRDNARCRWQPHYESGEMLFECFDPYFDISPFFAEFSQHPKLLEMVYKIYGEPGHVCHNQLIYKPPGSKGYDLHQDYIGWPIFPKSFHTVAIALDPSDEETGCIEAYAGCHQDGLLTPADNAFHHLSADRFVGKPCARLELEPGDAAVFGCLLPHVSGPNRSRDRWRRTLFYCFNAASDGGDMRLAYYEYYHQWKRDMAVEYGKPVLEFR
ncbi:MAG TPA: phytanoyl-CoA dioxygenase family protein [Pirellulales bacterium]|nr:phytanoyl-CoA dioxygenase family protein [Pirellulales bacterium]